ncbi:Fic family protein [Parabacteroides sp. PF5-6]|uniref:Fic family protein n=1 Tax=Parabacteroides sp. PF5-6 TaxID=1742403 RepID=UPI0024064109|nr:Fic family protein [Parabacteroides sp. PF5-6]MDF9831635.1 Fic family protein [Parabacteroides sp. PF5-6]
MPKCIYQYENWPRFTWNEKEIQVTLGKVRYLQGKLLGQMSVLGFSLKEETMLTTLTLDVLKSSEIEGENLNYEQVRSSIARKLGIEYAGMVYSNRDVEGIVEMMLDATQNYNTPIDDERLFGWHAALFPTGRSGMFKIDVGCYRNGEMQVVSGAMGKEKVHYEALSPDKVKSEMGTFLEWINKDATTDPVLKSAIAHLWFIIIHPFDDGNGRIARAISDLLLARSDDTAQRFYSLSSQILLEKKTYYETLKRVQHSSGDITEWLDWFLNCLYRSLLVTEETLQKVLYKADFWDRHKNTDFNARQRLMLNKLLDGFEGKLQTSKWAKITKSSPDTALRDIKDLIEKGVLKQEESGGRSTNYELVKVY